MKRNTHLSPDQYLSDAALGMTLSREMNAAAATIFEDESAKVTFFKEGKGDDESFGYEVTCDGKHQQIDSGYDLLTEAISAFIEWCDRNLDDEDDDEDD